jgi:hypothetical protein
VTSAVSSTWSAVRKKWTVVLLVLSEFSWVEVKCVCIQNKSYGCKHHLHTAVVWAPQLSSGLLLECSKSNCVFLEVLFLCCAFSDLNDNSWYFMSLTVVEYLEIHHGSKSCMTFCRCPTASHCYPCEGDSLVHSKGYDCTCSCHVFFHLGVQLTPPLFGYVKSFWGVCPHSHTCIFPIY